ncbi:MAG TPA: hypothetical protein VK281_18770, partial [Xanthobacteraceae bacterium]|nr:hypothetical protein [Xanthobacteraceae bacterium]
MSEQRYLTWKVHGVRAAIALLAVLTMWPAGAQDGRLPSLFPPLNSGSIAPSPPPWSGQAGASGHPLMTP